MPPVSKTYSCRGCGVSVTIPYGQSVTLVHATTDCPYHYERGSGNTIRYSDIETPFPGLTNQSAREYTRQLIEWHQDEIARFNDEIRWAEAWSREHNDGNPNLGGNLFTVTYPRMIEYYSRMVSKLLQSMGP
jgi:hypothetical protein